MQKLQRIIVFFCFFLFINIINIEADLPVIHASPVNYKIDTLSKVYSLPDEWNFICRDFQSFKKVQKTGLNWEKFSIHNDWVKVPKYSDHYNNAWYKLIINIENVDADAGLWLPMQMRGTQVYINGELIHETRTFNNGKTPPSVGKPVLIKIPSRIFNEGNNNLALRTGTLDYRAGLNGPVYIGNYKELYKRLS